MNRDSPSMRCSDRVMRSRARSGSKSAQRSPRISPRRAPVVADSSTGIAHSSSTFAASIRTRICAASGTFNSGRSIRGRLTARTGFAGMSPHATAWFSAAPRQARSCTIVAGFRPASRAASKHAWTCAGRSAVSCKVPIVDRT
ncbi:MAG: hypothetical protein M5U14_09590 [Acidimicrobiia bacterium]|nr:hypothetical protein [Acidimicrobiia bacterium]